MTEVHLDSSLLQHYGEIAPSNDVVTRLVTLARADSAARTGDGVRTDIGPQVHAMRPAASRRRWGIGLTAAACLVLAMGGIGYLGFHYGLSEAVQAPNTTIGAGMERTPATPRLVAVRYHADWCSRCPVVEPLFDILANKYGNESVLFVTIDVTDAMKRSQSHFLASDLGIDWLFDRPRETGMILLLDRENKEVLARLTETRQMPDLEGVLAANLPRMP